MGFKAWGEITGQLLGDMCLADHSSEKVSVFFFCFSKYDYI